LNKPDDLTIEEIRNFSSKMVRFSTLLFSGGEPFLREDLDEIVRIFVTQNKVSSIAIPTNGINTFQVVSMVEKILNDRRNSGVIFSISPSIDGLEDMDAFMRGRHDAFSSVLETLKELGKLKKYHKNLYISPNTVFSADNASQIEPLIEVINKFDFVDFHNLEAIRPKLVQEYPVQGLDLRLLQKAHLLIARANTVRLESKVKSAKNILLRMRNLYSLIGRIGHLRYAQKIKEGFLSGKASLFNCPAGKTMCVIEANGDVRLCELRRPVGNLRDNYYDLGKILKSSRAVEEANCICNSVCNCTHTCFISEYINQMLKHFNLKTALAIIYHYIEFNSAASQKKFKSYINRMRI
jgi:MoaA/NifB/PqqE/SkfB family radical SAM enzyme